MFVVFGDDRPAIRQQPDVPLARIDHWLDRQRHAGLQFEPCAGRAIVKYLGIFMEHPPDAVPAVFTYHRIVMCLGIGREFHEDPQVLHYGRPGTGMTLEAGMTFTIEPMINVGRRHTKILKDGWTVVTKDHSLSAQWEHTILVTPNGYEVLTLREGETI